MNIAFVKVQSRVLFLMTRLEMEMDQCSNNRDESLKIFLIMLHVITQHTENVDSSKSLIYRYIKATSISHLSTQLMQCDVVGHEYKQQGINNSS